MSLSISAQLNISRFKLSSGKASSDEENDGNIILKGWRLRLFQFFNNPKNVGYILEKAKEFHFKGIYLKNLRCILMVLGLLFFWNSLSPNFPSSNLLQFLLG